jgi:hypothetical protein
MPYDLLVETYATERIKILSVCSEFPDEDLPVRPKPDDPRGRSVLEQMAISVSAKNAPDVTK